MGTNGQLISTIKYEGQRFAIFDRVVCSHSLLPTHVDLFSLTEEFLFIPLQKKISSLKHQFSHLECSGVK